MPKFQTLLFIYFRYSVTVKPSLYAKYYFELRDLFENPVLIDFLFKILIFHFNKKFNL